MALQNRIKCTASIGANGVVLIGAALPGHLAVQDAWSPGNEWPGLTPYLLENAAGDWEIGHISVTSGGVIDGVGPLLQRSPTDGNVVFEEGTQGLVFSQVPTAEDINQLNRRRSDSASVWGGGANSIAQDVIYSAAFGPLSSANSNVSSAFGSPAQAQALCTTAFGSQTTAAAEYSVAVGAWVHAQCPGEVAVGSGQGFACVRQVPLKGNFSFAGGPAPCSDASLAYLALSDYGNTGGRADGPVVITGSLCIDDVSFYAVQARTRLVTFSYSAWVTATTATVIGTPAFTTVFAGGSASAVTLTIDAATGLPAIEVTSPGGSVNARGIMRIEIMNSVGGM